MIKLHQAINNAIFTLGSGSLTIDECQITEKAIWNGLSDLSPTPDSTLIGKATKLIEKLEELRTGMGEKLSPNQKINDLHAPISNLIGALQELVIKCN